MTHPRLGEVRTDAMDATKTDQRVLIDVSDDRLEAWIRPAKPDDPQPLTVDEILQALEKAKIVVGEPVLERIKEFVAFASTDDERPERLLVAKGRAVVEGTDESFNRHETLLQREQDWQGDAPVNYYTYNSIHLVEKDDPIGTLVPLVPGVPGVNVFGEILKPHGSPKEFTLDTSVRKSPDDALIVLANVAGQVDLSESALSIKEVFAIAKDVDFGVGNIDSPIDVQIRGTVHDAFVVKSRRAIAVGGAIESAEVDAEGDILVRGGILQKGKASVRSRGDIVARFCEEAELCAAGDVKICREVMSSRVHCEGKFLAERGAVIGGSAYAREGIEVATLGSDANVKTELVVGIHPDVIDEAERIRDSLKPKREVMERIRGAVGPLMADLKRLSAAQKEKATELMFEADQMDGDIAEAENKCSTMLQDARAHEIPYVLVTKIVHPGVTVRIGRRIASFHKAMQGPLKIEKRKIDNVTELVAINQLSGSIAVLPSSRIEGQTRAESAEPTESGHGGRGGSGC